MLYQIVVKTPKNQADACMRTQKEALLGLTKAKMIVKQKVVMHNEFYWVLDIPDEKELTKVTENCAKGEVTIRVFYRAIFNLFDRANKLVKKFELVGSIGMAWAKRWIYKQLNKKYQNTANLKNYIDNLSEKEFQDFLVISDKEEIEKLIAGNIITIKEYI